MTKHSNDKKPVPPTAKPAASSGAGQGTSNPPKLTATKTNPPSSPVPPAAKPPAAGKPRRNWRRLLGRLSLLLLVLLVVFRLALTFLLPPLFSKVASYYNLNCSYDRMQLTLLGGDVGLYGLKLTPRDAGAAGAGGKTEPLISAEYVRTSINPWSVLRGKLDIWRLEADDVEVLVDRLPNGKLPLLERFMTPSAAERKAAQTGSSSVDFTSPLRIEALRLTHLRARLRDGSVLPPVETAVALDIRVSKLGFTGAPTKFEITVGAEKILDALRIEGQATAAGRHLDASLQFRMNGLHPRPAAGYLVALGIQPAADDISLQFDATLKTDPPAPQPSKAVSAETGLTAQLEISNVAVRVDGTSVGALERLSVQVEKLDLNTVGLGQIVVRGGTGLIERTATGHLRLAGLELIPPSVPASPATPLPAPVISAAVPTSPATLPADLAPSSFTWYLRDCRAHQLSATLRDHAVAGGTQADLICKIDEFSLRNAGFIPHPETNKGDIKAPASEPTALRLRGSLPGIAQAWRVDALLQPLAQRKTLTLGIGIDGIRPDVLKPYLVAAGLESQLQNATFRAAVEGLVELSPTRFVGDARLTSLRLADGPQTLLALDNAQAKGVALDLAQGTLAIQEVLLQGPNLTARRTPDGTLATLGLRTLTSLQQTVAPGQDSIALATSTTTPATQHITAPASAASQISGGLLNHIQIGHFLWNQIQLTLEDQVVTPPAKITVQDAGFELHDLVWSADAHAPVKQATVQSWMIAPGLVEMFNLTGTLTPHSRGGAIDLQVDSSGLRIDLLAGYLKPLGLEPALDNGIFKSHLALRWDQLPDRLTADVDITDLHYTEFQGLANFADLTSLHIKDAWFGTTKGTDGTVRLECHLTQVALEKPTVTIQRDTDGSFWVAGLRYRPPAHTAIPAAAATTAPMPAAATLPPPSTIIVVDKLTCTKDGALIWGDAAHQPKLAAGLESNFEITNLVLGPAAPPPATITLQARVLRNVIDHLQMSGTFRLGTQVQEAHLALDAQGIGTGTLAGYLPPGLGLATHNGTFTAQIDARAEPAREGGLKTQLAFHDVIFRAGGGGDPAYNLDRPYLTLGQAIIDIPRLDPRGANGGSIHIAEISTQGLNLRVNHLADGTLEVAGVQIGQPHLDAPGEGASSLTQPATQVAASSAWTPRLRQRWPLVDIDKIDLNLQALHFHDAARRLGDLTLAEVNLTNIAPLHCLGPDAENQPPAEVRLTGHLDPLVGQFVINTRLTPFATQPRAEIDLLGSGINGTKLAQFLPALADKIDGTSLTQGQFTAKARVQLDLNRRDPLDFNLARRFSAEVSVSDFAFRATPEGPILAGLDLVNASSIRVDPARTSMRIRTLEISQPRGRASLESDGLHALGLVIKVPEEVTHPVPLPPGTAPAQTTASPATSAPQLAAALTTLPIPTIAPPAMQCGIDRIIVSGLDVVLADNVVSPPLVVPLNSLDLEVRDFNTRALTEPRQIRFGLLLGSGIIPLPIHTRSGGGLFAALGDLGRPTESQPATELRPLFAQFAASGRMAIYPAPQGWLKSATSGLELAALTGEAKRQNVTLTTGVFDSRIDLRFRGDNTIQSQSRITLTDLSMSEPPQGYFQRRFKLPGTLDLVIGQVQDAGGAITIPVNLPLNLKEPNGQIVSRKEIMNAVVDAIGSVLSKAVLSTPAKVTGLVFETFGGKIEPPHGAALYETLTLAPGSTTLDAQTREKLRAAALRLRDNESLELDIRHQLGTQDVALAQMRANPAPLDCQILLSDLRSKKTELLELRAEAVAAAEAQVAAQADAAVVQTAIERVTAINKELGRTETALDQVCDLLRPGAELQAARRTRSAAVSLARERMDQVSNLLLPIIPLADRERLIIVPPTFNPNDQQTGGSLIITLVKYAKQP